MVRLEKKMSECYKEISQICQDEDISKEFMTLSKEEIDHMNVLATGKNYLSHAPDIFKLKPGREVGLSPIQSKIDKLINDVHEKKIGLMEAINGAADLERILEQSHLDRIAEVKDASLKKLFESLSLGDKEHKKRLFRFMQRLYPPS
jgi:rubrerythrin